MGTREAIVRSEPQIEDLINLYAMTSRMRVLSLPRTVALCREPHTGDDRYILRAKQDDPRSA
jgi:hypothetical protein